MSWLSDNAHFTALLSEIRTALPPKTKAYLVGGAVRDLISSQIIHDLDFLLFTPGKVIRIARKIADALGAAFYALDKERDTARLIHSFPDGTRLNLDFAAPRGDGLKEDLLERDFTINAMAIDLDAMDQIIDPLNGRNDIFNKTLRACSENSFIHDPLRILRGARLAVQYDYRITPVTLLWMRQAIPNLSNVSPERVRDEIFRILSGKKVSSSLRVIEKIGILTNIFPELIDLEGVQQSHPHILDVWDHTLSVVRSLEELLFVLDVNTNLEEIGNHTYGLVSLQLGRYRQEIAAHFSKWINPDRSGKSLLFLAALYHDVGKAQTQSHDSKGNIHFYQHEKFSKEKLEDRAHDLRLSCQEIDRLGIIAGGHLRPLLLNQSSETPGRRAIYKFWRDLGEAGVDICLLSIADLMGTHGPSLASDTLMSHLRTVRTLLDAWWQNQQEMVSPPALINGTQLLKELDLKPGPIVGQILEAVRQAQVEGTVSDSQQALRYAREWLENPQEDL
ncbi:MAG TPA: HD domain-containing protein [Anaerolineales bacterium]|nr:HD domain-containing protein [Anaerolineales bacterium]